MKIKVSEATTIQLDWLVAKCEYSDEYDKDRVFLYHSGFDWAKHTVRIANQATCTRDLSFEWEPTTNWAQGGPIIEREDILVGPSPFPQGEFAATIGCEWGTGRFTQTGPTPLIAAMRCYVASELGNVVDVPEELT